MNYQLGYCTNVHAGVSLSQVRENLARYALPVKSRFSPDAPMGIGLWFSATAARQLLTNGRLPEWREWLQLQGLIPFTINGFPFGDFHQSKVKHDVYQPAWGQLERTRYTLDLIEILDGILPKGFRGSISTLPIGWGGDAANLSGNLSLEQATDQLTQVALRLQRLHADQGRHLVVCLEPEPGCVLDTSHDVVRFFEQYLFHQESGVADACRDHLGVCHDTCHASVMFERQDQVMDRYQQAGIRIGKVQVSSAVRVPFGEIPVEEHESAIVQLAEFAEDRYLHQTTCRTHGDVALTDDLPQKLRCLVPLDIRSGELRNQEWRVHFHVPLYVESFGHLSTTQSETLECLQYLREQSATDHFEAETYAWSVLPQSMVTGSLVDGIVDELVWVRNGLTPRPESATTRWLIENNRITVIVWPVRPTMADQTRPVRPERHPHRVK